MSGAKGGCPRCGCNRFMRGACTRCGYAGEDWRDKPIGEVSLIARKVTRQAIYWQDWVCLSCGRTISRPIGTTQGKCEGCGHPEMYCRDSSPPRPDQNITFDTWQCMACGTMLAFPKGQKPNGCSYCDRGGVLGQIQLPLDMWQCKECRNLITSPEGRQPGKCSVCGRSGRFAKVPPPKGHDMDVKFDTRLPYGWYITNPDARTAVIMTAANVEVARVKFTLPVIGSTEARVDIAIGGASAVIEGEKHGMALRHTIPSGFDGTLAPTSLRLWNASHEGLMVDVFEDGKVIHIHDSPNLRRAPAAPTKPGVILTTNYPGSYTVQEKPDGSVVLVSKHGEHVATARPSAVPAGGSGTVTSKTVKVGDVSKHTMEITVDAAQVKAAIGEAMTTLESVDRLSLGELGLMISGAMRRAQASSPQTIPELLGITVTARDDFEAVFKRYAEAVGRQGE
jgi:hypothetical protein